MADIIATATNRREIFAPRFGPVAILRGQDEGVDPVQALAQLFVSGARGPDETACLGGSFNPLVARQHDVGKVE